MLHGTNPSNRLKAFHTLSLGIGLGSMGAIQWTYMTIANDVGDAIPESIASAAFLSGLLKCLCCFIGVLIGGTFFRLSMKFQTKNTPTSRVNGTE